MNYAKMQVSDDNGVKNNLFLYGGWTHAVLQSGDRNGMCKLKFSKIYDISIYASETFQDPNPTNCTWSLKKCSRVIEKRLN